MSRHLSLTASVGRLTRFAMSPQSRAAFSALFSLLGCAAEPYSDCDDGPNNCPEGEDTRYCEDGWAPYGECYIINESGSGKSVWCCAED